MATALYITLLLLSHTISTALSLELHFYRKSCPRAELIVKSVLQRHVKKDPSIPAGLLRLHFHDCFIRGCDASVLLDSTEENIAEKEAPPNLTLRTYDVIDDIKAELEKECKGIVSCADILAMATRDGVAFSGGEEYALPTGRRDGKISRMSEVHLPGPSFSVQGALAAFQSINLDLEDLTTLLGAHTIGVAHCGLSFSNRLYNFTGKGDQDPALDPFYAANLKKLKCKGPNDNTTIVEMDPGSSRTFDLGYYKLLLKRRGLLQSDAALTTNAAVKSAITRLVNSPLEVFFKEFGLSMEKMGRVQVLTGSQGEIRKHCAVVNS
ncbi:uncharacterized protein A4U43_C03F9270 [Asparagus officinalis]|uniref:Peroxidase n=1 Tax=Asparagus officinalis TaxID=4686 RepID=A0A5P1FAF0_ASPOF|nr:uncharacterized protein A4U43_C03F9270 [Asparagus officinalis]